MHYSDEFSHPKPFWYFGSAVQTNGLNWRQIEQGFSSFFAKFLGIIQHGMSKPSPNCTFFFGFFPLCFWNYSQPIWEYRLNMSHSRQFQKNSRKFWGQFWPIPFGFNILWPALWPFSAIANLCRLIFEFSFCFDSSFACFLRENKFTCFDEKFVWIFQSFVPKFIWIFWASIRRLAPPTFIAFWR